MLRSTIKLLVNAGMSAEQIADHLSVPLDTVALLL
jgi:orotate phosphoribosyltransferase-like protein